MPSFNSPLEAFLYWEQTTPDTLFLKQPLNGRHITFSFKEAGVEARRLVSYFKGLGLQPQDHIAILSKNCAHWVISDLAIMMLGGVSIPIYPSLNAESIHQIVSHSDSKAIIVGKLDNFNAQRDGIPNIPVIGMDMYDISDGESWSSIIKDFDIVSNIVQPQSDHLHTIIYTSGTTGTPKGVMHTVSNFAETGKVVVERIPFPKTPRMFSYLPMAHVAERIGIGLSPMLLGGNITFVDSIDTFAAELEATQPDIFFAVPRIWEKFQDRILQTLPQKRLRFVLSIPFLNRIFIKKLKYKLGLSKATFICSGAAPLAISTSKWYKRLDIDICQGYGMTEDCILSHFGLPSANKIGTVGKVMTGVDVKFSEAGEILVKNPALMKGYYKNPELTAEVFTEDGYLKTGDIGEYDHEGYLSITGRVKDQFKTDKGKYISPAPIELACMVNNTIEQVCIVGTGIPQPIALVVLSELGKTMDRAEVVNSLTASIEALNPTLEKHERIEKVVIMKTDWSIDNNLLTPTLKVKRNAVEKLYQPLYRTWFDTNEKVIFIYR